MLNMIINNNYLTVIINLQNSLRSSHIGENTIKFTILHITVYELVKTIQCFAIIVVKRRYTKS